MAKVVQCRSALVGHVGTMYARTNAASIGEPMLVVRLCGFVRDMETRQEVVWEIFCDCTSQLDKRTPSRVYPHEAYRRRW